MDSIFWDQKRGRFPITAQFSFSARVSNTFQPTAHFAPPGYKIEIGERYMLDCDDVKQALPPDAQPQLDADGKKLTWAFPYIKKSKLHCHYKLLPE